jgi:hypothetical protein
MTYATPRYKAQAAGVVFASPVAGHCEGNMVRVASKNIRVNVFVQ